MSDTSTSEQPDEPDADKPKQTERPSPLSDRRCRSCGGLPRWESIADAWGERWLGLCGCGGVQSFFPDRRHPEAQPAEPLTMFLQGHRAPRRPANPPWIRLFLHSLQPPYSITWRYDHRPCASCQAHATFGLLAWPQDWVSAICTLCLNCGWTETTYTNHQQGAQANCVDGDAWTPPCPAVQRLRTCVYRLHAHSDDADDA